MAFFQGIRRLILAIFRKILFLWVRTQVTGATPEALGLNPQQPVCYVLQYSSLSSRLVLEQEVLRAGLPYDTRNKAPTSVAVPGFVFLYRRVGRLLRGGRQTPVATDNFKTMIRHASQNPDQDWHIVPVSLFWGRSPDKEKSLFKL
ncbi:MAG TPA: glycerol-3-phosphate 1-O-acyltransferase, partial [Marinobacter sp.]|nr:glycerol-3-phosphate 1-O-acyltransferase [Marinobacter sp.]